MTTKTGAASNIDVDKYRLRRFVERLIDLGEVEIHEEPVPLTALSAVIEASDKALLFRNAGPERLEIAAKTAGSRRRLAAAFDTTEEKLYDEYFMNQVPDEGKQVPQYLVALTEPRDGLPFDYDQIRVFTWNLRRHRYETAYRDRRLSGVFPISVGKQNFEKEGVLPTFTLKLKDESGQVTSSTYKLNGPVVKRVVAEGEQPKAPHVAPEKRQARRARLRKK